MKNPTDIIARRKDSKKLGISGAVIFFFSGLLCANGWFYSLSVIFMIIGSVALLGTLLEAINTKIRGLLLLLAFPIGMIGGLVIFQAPIYNFSIMFILSLMMPIPFLNIIALVLIVAAGILFLTIPTKEMSYKADS